MIGRGSSSPVLMEKDCFRLKPNVNKMVELTLSQLQSETSKPLHIERWVVQSPTTLYATCARVCVVFVHISMLYVCTYV